MHQAGMNAGKILCDVTFGSYMGRHLAGGVVGAVAGDVLYQGAAYLSAHERGEAYQWDWNLSLQAVALGAVSSAAAATGQWRFHRACFSLGTPIRTPEGSKPIEQIKAGDLVLSRDENDPQGEVLPKLVEETFVTEGWIIELRIGGQVIRTTIEHPFFVLGKGWTAAGLLNSGVLLSCEDGGWLCLDEVSETAQFETVFNMRIRDFHTYFVGSSTEWGFSIWAHNEYRAFRDLLPMLDEEQALIAYNHAINPGTESAPISVSDRRTKMNRYLAVLKQRNGPDIPLEIRRAAFEAAQVPYARSPEGLNGWVLQDNWPSGNKFIAPDGTAHDTRELMIWHWKRVTQQASAKEAPLGGPIREGWRLDGQDPNVKPLEWPFNWHKPSDNYGSWEVRAGQLFLRPTESATQLAGLQGHVLIPWAHGVPDFQELAYKQQNLTITTELSGVQNTDVHRIAVELAAQKWEGFTTAQAVKDYWFEQQLTPHHFRIVGATNIIQLVPMAVSQTFRHTGTAQGLRGGGS